MKPKKIENKKTLEYKCFVVIPYDHEVLFGCDKPVDSRGRTPSALVGTVIRSADTNYTIGAKIAIGCCVECRNVEEDYVPQVLGTDDGEDWLGDYYED